jgi:4-hydroxy-2-oxovalerate aldolase
MGRHVHILDTTLRDGSHSVGHRFRPDQVARLAGMLDAAGVWAIAVGHGDGLGARSRQYGFGAFSDADLLAAAAGVIDRAELAVALLPGIGTKKDLREARDAGATLVRVSTVITEADIGVQHLGLARDLGMTAHSHLNMAAIASVEQTVESARIVVAAGSTGVYLVDTAGAFMPDDVRARVVALREALDDDIAIGIHEHNNLSLAVANSVVAVQEGATIVDVALAGMGAGAGNCQNEAVVAVLDRLGYDTGVDLFRLQDAADDYVRPELMPGPIVVDRLTATMGYANVPASFLLHIVRAAKRFDVDARDIIVALGERHAVTGQEDLILDVAAALRTA